jgi:alkylation response protein AidB-like acyl-CoA dehydrogenase
MERLILMDELQLAPAPLPLHFNVTMLGPVLLRYGTPEQKCDWLPRLARLDVWFCQGFSEPGAGSDLASLRTSARREGDHYVVNGQKIWTTYAHMADWIFCLVRTDPQAARRQEGISFLLIDLKTPGITIRPIEDLTGDRHFTEVFFDEVDLPHEALIGSEGSGWSQVTAELAFERSGPERIYSSMVLLEAWLEFLRASRSDDPAAIALAGRILVHKATLRSMSVAVTAKVGAGGSPMTEASLVKDLGTELEQFTPIAIADAIATAQANAAASARSEGGATEVPAALLRTLAYITQFAPTFSLRGGTREVLRGLIARGLGLR